METDTEQINDNLRRLAPTHMHVCPKCGESMPGFREDAKRCGDPKERLCGKCLMEICRRPL